MPNSQNKFPYPSQSLQGQKGRQPVFTVNPRGGRHQDNNRGLQMQSPQFMGKLRNPSGSLTLLALLLGMINIGIIGYNFSYFKGTWRNNLFHSELNFLVTFSIAFVGTIVNVAGNLASQQPYANHTIHEMIANATYGFLTALAGMILLIQLTVYGRYFVNQYEIKIVSSIVGMIEGLVYLINAALLNQSAKTLK